MASRTYWTITIPTGSKALEKCARFFGVLLARNRVSRKLFLQIIILAYSVGKFSLQFYNFLSDEYKLILIESDMLLHNNGRSVLDNQLVDHVNQTHGEPPTVNGKTPNV